MNTYLKVLAINLRERHSFAPGLPTAAEAVPGLSVPVWSGLIGPAGMPREVVSRLNAVLKQPEVVAKIAEGRSVVWPTSPDEFRAHIDTEIKRWIKLATEAGIQPE